MTTARRIAVGAIVLALVVIGLVRLVGSNGDPEPTGPATLESLEVPGSGVIRWSPDATKLAVLVDGELVVVRVRDAEVLGRSGRRVVDAAWMPDGTRVLLVEGPIPTGEIAAVSASGQVRGVTKLQPTIPFASGRGLAVNSTGTQAAAITVRTDAIGGGKHFDVAVVDVQRGGTRVYRTDAREESNPVFVDDSTVAYAAELPGGQVRLHTIDLVSGRVRAHGQIHDGPYAALASGEVVVAHRAAQGAVRLDAVDLAGGTRVLGVLPAHTRPVAVDRFATHALVRRFGGLQGTRLAIEVLSK